jgi:hypothetical protein
MKRRDWAREGIRHYNAYLAKVVKAVGSPLTLSREFNMVWQHYCAKKGCKTAAREILRGRNA